MLKFKFSMIVILLPAYIITSSRAHYNLEKLLMKNEKSKSLSFVFCNGMLCEISVTLAQP